MICPVINHKIKKPNSITVYWIKKYSVTEICQSAWINFFFVSSELMKENTLLIPFLIDSKNVSPVPTGSGIPSIIED
jgi:hypothetical protein